MSDDVLLEPDKAYKSKYKELHYQNTVKYFDELTKKGNVPIEENKKTCQEYYKKLDEIKKLESKISAQNGLMIFIIIMMVMLSIVGILLFIFLLNSNLPFAIVSLVLPIIFVVFGIIYIIKVIRPKIKKLKEEKAILEEKAQELKNLAWQQMAGLNSKYDWNIAAEIFEMTIPLFQMDQYFDNKKYQYLHDKYNLSANDEENVSTYFCQSGSILGNPFLLCKDYRMDWILKNYTGSLTIHWTTRVKTKNGYSTQSHTQTLTATIQKQAPNYSYVTYLIYGNDAAPKLVFSRKPSGQSGKTDKEINKYVKERVKDLDKKAKKAVTNSESYTRLGNDEFEALFGGEDRNNEVEYRLLFTPLAQKNLLSLIKNNEAYGDDFYFQKDHQLNFIQSAHSQNTDYYSNPAKFIHFDYEKAKEIFINYNAEYFKALYFDFAPLISIPLYQQHKSFEYIYDKEYESNISCYEHEAMANSFDINLLKPQNANTPSILKTHLVRKNDMFDEVGIVAHAFRAEKRVTYVTKLGGDGKFHDVPVYWLEYFPIEAETKMAIEAKNSSRYEYNNQKYNQKFTDFMNKVSLPNGFTYERGLFAALLLSGVTSDNIKSVNNIYETASQVESKLSTEEIINRLIREANSLDSQDTSNENLKTDEDILNDENQQAVEVKLDEKELVEPTDENPEENKEKGEN